MSNARSLVDLERNVICLEVQKNLLVKTKYEFLSCSSQSTASRGWVTDNFLRYTPPVYLEFVLNIEKTILR